MLTFDSNFQKDRKKATGSVGEGVEGAVKVGKYGCTVLERGVTQIKALDDLQ